MVCKGTMAKTYDNGNIISGRDDLNGDYFMYKGKLIQVPSGTKENGGERYSYGLKAFRCWFELTANTPAEGKPSQVSLLIDGVEASTAPTPWTIPSVSRLVNHPGSIIFFSQLQSKLIPASIHSWG